MDWPETLSTPRLTLRLPRPADAPAIFSGYAQDPEVTRFLTWRPHVKVEETLRHIERCLTDWRSRSGHLAWVLTLQGEERALGMIGVRPEGHKVSLGYVLARAFWGKGLMPEAARAVVTATFSNASVFRLWSVCDVENTASARVMEKVGMSREGILRKFVVHPNVSDVPRDAFCYSIADRPR